MTPHWVATERLDGGEAVWSLATFTGRGAVGGDVLQSLKEEVVHNPLNRDDKL